MASHSGGLASDPVALGPVPISPDIADRRNPLNDRDGTYSSIPEGCTDHRPVRGRPLKVVLTISAVYLAVLGLGFMFAPREIGIHAVPADASPALIAYLRVFGGPFLGIAVLNWLTRNAEPSSVRDAVVLGNLVGFGSVTLMDVWAVFSGGAREAQKLFLGIHLLLTVAFVLAWRTGSRAPRS